MPKNGQNKLLIIPLGGMGEIGKNMTVIQYGKEILLIDAGLMFPEEDMLGIDMVIPDITYLIENKDNIKGILLTHGHEDHIGALPYLLQQIDAPLYGTKLTLGLVEVKLKEYKLKKNISMNVIRPPATINIGSFTVDFIRVNHSIPDSVGFAIHTPVGIVVHTGDFKLDQTPVNGEKADLHKFAELGSKGVLVLMSDSTNAEREGYTMSEKVVGKTIEDIFKSITGRIIVATFASNIHRIQQIFDAASKNGRKVAVIGRSMVNVVNIALELGYLTIPKSLLVDLDEINRLPKERVVIITTGSQGEPMSALTRMAMSEHKKVEIMPGDTVLISASPIPGNEKFVARTI
ncbi:MAG: ribonuclease J, partial [Tepidanaerobacteraceae bacterium]